MARILAAAVGTGALFVGGLAQGAFTGWFPAQVNTAGLGWDANGYDSNALITYRIYATFDGANPNEGVSTVSDFGATLSSGLSFYNSVGPGLTSDFAPSDLTGPPFNFWENQWDTYLTIGATSTATDLGLLTTPNLETNLGGLQNSFSSGAEAYTLVPGQESQGLAANHGNAVLLMQFTVERDTEPGLFTLEPFSLAVFNSSIADVQLFNLNLGGISFIIPPIPAPGALAVLGLAGVMSMKRRRRA